MYLARGRTACGDQSVKYKFTISRRAEQIEFSRRIIFYNINGACRFRGTRVCRGATVFRRRRGEIPVVSRPRIAHNNYAVLLFILLLLVLLLFFIIFLLYIVIPVSFYIPVRASRLVAICRTYTRIRYYVCRRLKLDDGKCVCN